MTARVRPPRAGPPTAPRPEQLRDERGAAVAEYAMVAALLTLLFAGLLQLGLALHVRNTLVDCVSQGARFGALADRSPADGAARARALIAASLPGGYAGQVSARYARVGDLPVVEVTASAPLPVIGLVGTGSRLTVRGHGAVEVLP